MGSGLDHLRQLYAPQRSWAGLKKVSGPVGGGRLRRSAPAVACAATSGVLVSTAGPVRPPHRNHPRVEVDVIPCAARQPRARSRACALRQSAARAWRTACRRAAGRCCARPRAAGRAAPRPAPVLPGRPPARTPREAWKIEMLLDSDRVRSKNSGPSRAFLTDSARSSRLRSAVACGSAASSSLYTSAALRPPSGRRPS